MEKTSKTSKIVSLLFYLVLKDFYPTINEKHLSKFLSFDEIKTYITRFINFYKQNWYTI